MGVMGKEGVRFRAGKATGGKVKFLMLKLNKTKTNKQEQ